MTGIVTTLRAEAHSGFSRMRGARLVGTLPVTEGVVNELLSSRAGAISGLRIEIHDSNRLVVRYGHLYATAFLGDVVDFSGEPKLHLRLASATIAWALKKVVKLPDVHFDGPHVTVDLGTPRYMQGLANIATSPGKLEVQFDIAIA